MGQLKKKKKQIQEPEYFVSATNQKVLNYKVYNLTKTETILWFLVAFAIGAAVAYLFYGGIGKDEYRNATTVTYVCNTIFMVGAGLASGRFFLPIRKEQIIQKRLKLLYKQFVDLLESLSTSISSGKNVPHAFMDAKKDLLIQYPADAHIINEVDQIIAGFEHNIAIEDMLVDFGKRSGIKDIYNFGKVFETAYRKGGNIKDIIRSTNEIISDKMSIELEIQTKMTSNKNEQNLMVFMPIVIVGMIKFMGSDFADNFTSPTGIISTTLGVGAFILSYFVGKAVMKIEV